MTTLTLIDTEAHALELPDTAPIPATGRSRRSPALLRPLAACGADVLTGLLPGGARLALDTHLKTSVVDWDHQAPAPRLMERRGYPVHRCVPRTSCGGAGCALLAARGAGIRLVIPTPDRSACRRSSARLHCSAWAAAVSRSRNAGSRAATTRARVCFKPRLSWAGRGRNGPGRGEQPRRRGVSDTRGIPLWARRQRCPVGFRRHILAVRRSATPAAPPSGGR